MTLSVQLGLLLALGTAFGSIVGFLYKHRGAVESPPVDPRRPLSSSLSLFRSRWYVLGILVALGSWGLHVAALKLAPISLVQSVIAGGLVLPEDPLLPALRIAAFALVILAASLTPPPIRAAGIDPGAQPRPPAGPAGAQPARAVTRS